MAISKHLPDTVSTTSAQTDATDSLTKHVLRKNALKNHEATNSGYRHSMHLAYAKIGAVLGTLGEKNPPEFHAICMQNCRKLTKTSVSSFILTSILMKIICIS